MASIRGERLIQRFLALAAAGLIAYLFADTGRWLVHQWWTGEYYSHGPLVVVVGGVLAWRASRGICPAPSRIGLLVVAVALAGHLGALVARAPSLSAFLFLVVLVGVALWWGGGPALKGFAFPLAFCALAIPLPFMDLLAFPLQMASAQMAASLVNLWGVPASFQGGQVSLTECALTVGAPCSGLRSIVAMAALGSLAAWGLAGPWWGRGLVLGVAVPVAWLSNMLRVAALLTVAHVWGADVALGAFHAASSPAFFLGGVGMMAGVAWGVGCRNLRSGL
ncbi:MAG: exosortase/archaeosortase family protein [Anaerolineae bacterium]